MAAPVLYGPAYSTYARTVRLALEEKGVEYRLEEVDIMKGETQAPGYLAKHPFGKVPAFVHDGFALYETSAITRYVDEAFSGPTLQPSDLRQRARMNQIIAVIDSYLYGTLITKIVVQRAVVPLMGGTPDEAVIAEAIPQAEKAVKALEDLAGEGPFLVGSEPSLADLHLVPIFAYGVQMPEGARVMAEAPRLTGWWRRIVDRPSVRNTEPKLG